MRNRRTLLARKLRQRMTLSEVRVWSYLRRRQMDGWKFRRQHPIGEYIVDFACPAARLVVELDGSSHDGEVAFNYGNARQRWLEYRGWTVLRFRADYPGLDPIQGVWDAIDQALSTLPKPITPPALRATSPLSGEGGGRG